MLRALLREQREQLEQYFTKFPFEQAEQIVDLLEVCKGTVLFSGIGKSGYIAQKIAATFLSTGTKAFFLDPVHAVHGDLGCVCEQDLVVLLSKSGESKELLELLPFIAKRAAKSIAVVAQENCRLAKLCDFFIQLPLEKELCPYNLAPTISSEIQLLFGDLLAMTLMKRKNVSLQDYALNHPGGLIGKKISLKVADIMLQGDALPLCRPKDRLLDVLPELSQKKCGCLLVIDEQRQLQGIFTDGDLRRWLQVKGAALLNSSLQELMTQTPRWTHPHVLAFEAMQQMEEDSTRLITLLPVLEQERIVGLLRMHDILQTGLASES